MQLLKYLFDLLDLILSFYKNSLSLSIIYLFAKERKESDKPERNSKTFCKSYYFEKILKAISEHFSYKNFKRLIFFVMFPSDCSIY